MPNIHGALIHVPRPPAAKAKFGAKAAGKAKSAWSNSRAGRATRTAYHNATTTRGKEWGERRKFGTKSEDLKEGMADVRLSRAHAALTGGVIGMVGGSALGGPIGTRNKQIGRNELAIARNKKALEKRLFPKPGQAHLITDLGTGAARAEKAVYGHHPWKWGVGGMATGAAISGPAALSVRSQQKKKLAEQKTIRTAQASQLRAKRKFSKMGDTELRHRQKVQGNIGRTTSTLGLTGLGITGVSALAARKGKVGTGTLKAIRKIPKLGGVTPEKMKNAAINTGIVSGGIGGVGGFNQASIYSAEAKRRKQPVAKRNAATSLGIEPPYVSDISKDWSPIATNYDPEAKRHRRNRIQQVGLTAASGATGAGAAGYGTKAAKTVSANWSKGQRRARHLPTVKTAQAARKVAAGKHGKVAAGLAGASVATGLGAAFVNRQRKGSWQSYGKRDTSARDDTMISAFGVDHGEEVSKLGEWKTIDQRERSQTRARKTIRTAGAGAALGVGALAVGMKGHGGAVTRAVARGSKQAYSANRNLAGASRLNAARGAGHYASANLKRLSTGQKTHAALTAGGAGLIGGSAAAGIGAKSGHTYQQHKINQRRRSNFNRRKS